MKQRFLVTGGAGFIGSNLVDQLISQNHHVFVIDNLSTGKNNNINKKAEFIKLDINDSKVVQVVVKINPDYIYHLAAQTSVSKSIIDPKGEFRTNLIALIPILAAAVKVKVRKFVFASSAAVYGDSEKLPISENFPKNPTSPYGISKFCAEFLVSNYGNRVGLPFTTLRFSNVYGPRQDCSQEGGVVAIFVNAILKGNGISIFGSGEQTRDFIFVSDIVKASLLAQKNNLVGIFNVGTNKQTSVNDLAKNIENILKTKVAKTYFPNRDLEIENSALDSSKIKKQTNWSPQVDIESGLKKTINFFK